jgi:hypothetical protein
MSLDEALKTYKTVSATKKEKDAARIEIECVDTPDGKGEGYNVRVWPREKKSKGKKDYPRYEPSIPRIFKTAKEVLAYLKEVL